MSIKTYKETIELKKKLESIKGKVGLLDVDGSSYWHIQFYYLDFDTIIASVDMQEELTKQLEAIVDNIEVLADNLKKYLEVLNVD